MLFRLEVTLLAQMFLSRKSSTASFVMDEQNLLWERDPEWWDQSARSCFRLAGPTRDIVSIR